MSARGDPICTADQAKAPTPQISRWRIDVPCSRTSRIAAHAMTRLAPLLVKLARRFLRLDTRRLWPDLGRAWSWGLQPLPRAQESRSGPEHQSGTEHPHASRTSAIPTAESPTASQGQRPGGRDAFAQRGADRASGCPGAAASLHLPGKRISNGDHGYRFRWQLESPWTAGFWASPARLEIVMAMRCRRRIRWKSPAPRGEFQ